jgi:type I restriction enzyme M protein
MLDLRDVYRKVSSNLHDFTPEQLANIQAVVGLYRGKREVFDKTVSHYFSTINNHLSQITAQANSLADNYTKGIQTFFEKLLPKATLAQWNETFDADDIESITQLATAFSKTKLTYNNTEVLQTLTKDNTDQLKKGKRAYNNFLKAINAFVKEAGKEGDLRKQKEWKEQVIDQLKQMELDFVDFSHTIDQALYFNKEAHWLVSRFPKSEYTDIAGLCKVATKEEIAVIKKYIAKFSKNGKIIMSEAHLERILDSCQNRSFDRVKYLMLIEGYENVYSKKLDYTGFLWKKS